MNKINEIWVWVAIDEDAEKICTFPITKEIAVPLICLDEEQMMRTKVSAQYIAKEFGAELKLLRFTNREEIETIPGKKEES